MKYRWIVLGLLSLSAAAHADVQVNFVHPEKFSDIRDSNGFRDDSMLKELKAYMVKEAGQVLPGREVRFDVTDVNLAGEIEPWRDARWIRVMRSVTPPSIVLSYEVREGGRVVQHGEATLRDIAYQDRSIAPTFSSDPLRYEKSMLDRWMRQEFNAKVATVR